MSISKRRRVCAQLQPCPADWQPQVSSRVVVAYSENHGGRSKEGGPGIIVTLDATSKAADIKMHAGNGRIVRKGVPLAEYWAAGYAARDAPPLPPPLPLQPLPPPVVPPQPPQPPIELCRECRGFLGDAREAHRVEFMRRGQTIRRQAEQIEKMRTAAEQNAFCQTRSASLIEANHKLRAKIKKMEGDRKPGSAWYAVLVRKLYADLKKHIVDNYWTRSMAAAIKYGARMSELQWDMARHNLFGEWVPNAAFPSQITNADGPESWVPQGEWEQGCFPGTDIPLPMPPCSKTIAKWAKEIAWGAGLETDLEGKAARFKFERRMRHYLCQEVPSFWDEQRNNSNVVEVQVMADAFGMFRGRPFTNLNFRIPQLAFLVNSPKEMRQIALYEGKDDGANIRRELAPIIVNSYCPKIETVIV